LRTATSRTLREQTIGRGLRLPYGKRTGIPMIDSVTITAHDKFDEIIAEAQKGDSIFKVDGVIYAEMEEEKSIVVTQAVVRATLFETDAQKAELFEKAKVDHNNPVFHEVIHDFEKQAKELLQKEQHPSLVTIENSRNITNEIKKDLGERYRDNTDAQRLIDLVVENYYPELVKRYVDGQMYIPKIKTEILGDERYIIDDFDLDLSDMVYVPIKNDVILKNLLDNNELDIIVKGETIDLESFKPEIKLVEGIRNIDEIDYEKCPEIIRKIVVQFLEHYRSQYSEEDIRSICFVEYKSITGQFEKQLLQHLAIAYDDILDTVMGIESMYMEIFWILLQKILKIFMKSLKMKTLSLLYMTVLKRQLKHHTSLTVILKDYLQ